MADSRQLAGVVGPSLIATGATEALNMGVFASQIAPVVYLNGAILFVAGLAIIRIHNVWVWRWPAALTLTGWFAIVGGLYRMIMPGAPQAPATPPTYLALAGIVVTGVILSLAAYRPRRSSSE